jgi:hypothetical protein
MSKLHLIRIGNHENISTHSKINRRGSLEQILFTGNRKTLTKRTKGNEKQMMRNFLKVRKIRHRGTLK